MSSHSDDYHDLVAHRRFLDEVENGIRMVNREIIHEKIPQITKDRFLKFAVLVSRLRGEYLGAAFDLVEAGAHIPADTVVQSLKAKREKFEEALNAFESLHRAIERGYVDVAKNSDAG